VLALSLLAFMYLFKFQFVASVAFSLTKDNFEEGHKIALLFHFFTLPEFIDGHRAHRIIITILSALLMVIAHLIPLFYGLLRLLVTGPAKLNFSDEAILIIACAVGIYVFVMLLLVWKNTKKHLPYFFGFTNKFKK
jgi:hypothetical protein